MFQGWLKRGLLVTSGDPAVLEAVLPPSVTEVTVSSLSVCGLLVRRTEMH